MECKACDSKQLFKVFDASRRKRNRKKREGDGNSVASDESAVKGHRISSAKGSLQNVTVVRAADGALEHKSRERERSLSPSRSRGDNTRGSPTVTRRHRRCPREGISLALKAGNPLPSDNQDIEEATETSKDQDSFIYTYLEDALKREKKQRHSRKHDCLGREKDGRDAGREREEYGENVERRHRHRRRQEDAPSPDNEKQTKAKTIAPQIDQTVLLETFAKLCATLNEKTEQLNQLKRSLSHKSLQCETFSGHGSDMEHQPVKLRSHENSPENLPLARTRTKSNVNNGRVRSHENIAVSNTRLNKKVDKCECCPTYDNIRQRYNSKMDIRVKESQTRYRDRPFDRTYTCYRAQIEPREYRNFDKEDRRYEDDRRRYVEEKTSRSFEVDRPLYEDRRPTSRSDSIREKRYVERNKDRKYEPKDKYYEEKIDARERHFTGKDRLSKRNMCDRNSVVSREDSYRDRDKYSERERDSGLSVADEASTVSGKSTYLRVVKREIAEQREAMDKMMNLWKELMRCFKGISQTQKPDTSTYEEINKQRSEMAEMSTMWQECLQRYRDMSNEFNSLKQQVALASENPTRDTTPAPIPPVCLEAEAMQMQHNSQFRMPPNYPNMVAPMPYPSQSPLRARTSPPAWWWCEREPARSPRRHTPDSRGSRDRRRRHKEREPADSRTRNDRYKEKSKPGAAKSEHRHRKR